MDKKEFEFIISEGEGYNIEFKESLSSDLGKEICAFANSIGGKVLIGISDKKQINGIEITNKLKSQIHDIVRNLDPKLEVSLDKFSNVLIINVPEGKDKPYSANGKFYVRQGTNSQQLNRDEIREFFQKEGKISFDDKPNIQFDLNKDFNKNAFSFFIEKSKISSVLTKEQILNNLELLEEGKIKNAGVLLFCNKVTRFFLNAQITCALFLGDDKVSILDKKEFERDLYLNYEEVIKYIKSKLNTEYIIKTAGPREEKLELPEDALREALLNAIVHRDYFSNAEIQIYIFKNRLEIVNPGGLVPGMKISDLGKKSLSRNKLLFGLLQRMNLVEKAGTGILRIKNAMKDYKLESPLIETDENWFTITFHRPDSQKESYEQRFYRGSGQKSTRKVPEKYQKILNELRVEPNISRIELAQKLNEEQTTIQSKLRTLVKEGFIRRVGPAKGGYWEIIDGNN